jgi:hypothetical protein
MGRGREPILPFVIADSFHFEKSPGITRFQAGIESSTAKVPRFTIQFDFHATVEPPETVGDAWLAALLVPCMFAGERLEIRAPVSRRLVRTASEIQRIFHTWYPALLSGIEVVTPQLAATGCNDDTGAVATFFSGGVDSWFTLENHRAEISALLTVKGFDLPAADEKIWPELMRANQEIAAERQIELINIETNIRDCVDPGLGCFHRRYEGDDFWGSCYHGSCMAAAGLFLQNHFARILVPASWQYARLQPWGSHPLLDCLWSNGRLEFCHDGAEASRLQKISRISRLNGALRHLRVCPMHPAGRYNCGECEKCRRTLLTLRLFGVDETSLRFDRPLDLRDFEMNPPKRHLRPLYREILDEAVARNDQEAIRCLRVLAGDKLSPRYEWRRWSSRMRRSISKRLGRLKS